MRWVLLMCVLKAGFCEAQSTLRFVGLPASVRAKVPVGPIVLERTLSDGSPDRGAQRVVALTGFESTGEISALPPRSPWQQTAYPVIFAAGASVSPPFLFRPIQEGTTTFAARGVGFVSATQDVDVGSFFFDDDFESGSVVMSSPDAGKWIALNAQPGNVVAASPRAHQGLWGLSTIDRNVRAGGRIEAALTVDLSPITGDNAFRGWIMRRNQTKDTTVLVKSEVPNLSAGQWDIMVNPSGALGMHVWSTSGMLTFDALAGPALPLGTWHLLEVIHRGSQTPDASVEVYVDARKNIAVSNIDMSTGDFRSGGITIGAFYQVDATSTIDLDWDDLRFGPVPHASRLKVADGQTVTAGVCAPIQVALTDVFGQPAPAPRTVPLRANQLLFVDTLCSSSALSLSAGASSVVLYGQFVAPTTTLNVAADDFISESGAILATMSQGSGTDAGPATDAGPEADAGPGTEPTTDTPQRRQLAVGCSASPFGPPPLSLLALVGLAVFARLRRKGR